MFRGIIFRTAAFRGTGVGLMETGTLNVEDFKNYRSRFLLIADTGANFMLNGEMIDGSLGVLIKTEGYYEAMINGPDGLLHVSRFCYWRTAIAQIAVVSEATSVLDLDYRQQRSNKGSDMTLYHDHPIAAYIYDTGEPVIGGIVADRDFYRAANEVSAVRILPARSVYIHDDPIVWQTGYQKHIGSLVRPSIANGHYYRCIVAGVTGAGEPAWPTVPGDTVADGGATWQCIAGSRELHYSQRITTG